LNQFILGDPYPNPFNPSVMMDLTNHEASEYTISIINLKGEKVYHKSLGILEPGNHSIKWDGKNILGNPSPSGIYFLVFSNSKNIENKKLILLR
jgi:flagellar hook assembly protein FlgD